ncbi:MAG: N-acetylmuramoyl-L-alanine amidase CwlD [Firmicutes bacterium]|nr:N-acetylmuramoyl-L-alanine amidase CwlD [Bacillota bacterium]
MNKLYSLIMFFICLFCVSTVRALNLPLLGKVIYIDPGHGGKDPGAIYGNDIESNINLELSKQLYLELTRNGAIVYLTRNDNYDLSLPNATSRKKSDLSQRVKIINNSNADLYLSIHLNADTSSTWRGAQVFYDNINSKNKELAQIMQEEYISNLNTKREYKNIKGHFLYRRINIPGVLIEAGFLTNSSDRYLLKSEEYQKKFAKITTLGVIKYFKNS